MKCTVIAIPDDRANIATTTREALKNLIASTSKEESTTKEYILNEQDLGQINRHKEFFKHSVKELPEKVANTIDNNTAIGSKRARFLPEASKILGAGVSVAYILRELVGRMRENTVDDYSAIRTAKILEATSKAFKSSLYQDSDYNLSKRMQDTLNGIYWALAKVNNLGYSEDFINVTNALRIMGVTKETISTTSLAEARRFAELLSRNYSVSLTNNGDVTRYITMWKPFLPKKPRKLNSVSSFLIDYNIDDKTQIKIINDVLARQLTWVHELLLDIPIGKVFSKGGQIYFSGFITLKDKLTLNFKCVKLGSVLAQLHGHNNNSQLVESAKERLISNCNSLDFNIDFVPNDLSFSPYYQEFGRSGVASCMTHGDKIITFEGDDQTSIYSAKYWGYGDNNLALVIAKREDRIVGRGILNTNTKALVRWYGDPAAKAFLRSKFGIVVDSRMAMEGVSLPLFAKRISTNNEYFTYIMPYIDCDGYAIPTLEFGKPSVVIDCNATNKGLRIHETGGFRVADLERLPHALLVDYYNFNCVGDWNYDSNRELLGNIVIAAQQGAEIDGLSNEAHAA